MNSAHELERLRKLREVYDLSLRICDPIEFQYRHHNLLQAIAEHLIHPLQEHELAEKSKLALKKPRKKKDAK